MNRRIEELSMNAWPALNTYFYDGWVLRATKRYTKRANSIYPLYEGVKEFPEKVAFCESFYKDLAMPTTFKLHDGEAHHALDIYLEDQGYHVLTPTDVLIKDLRDFKLEGDLTYEVVHGYSEKWADHYGDIICGKDTSDRSMQVRALQKTMLQSIVAPSFYVFIEADGQVIASGNGVVEDGYLGVFNLVVEEAYRAKGYGRLAMLSILEEGKKLGASKSYLQVICNNEVAENLYRSLGYDQLYRYWYRRKQAQE